MADRAVPRVVFRAGFPWMTHREYAAVQRYEIAVACEGVLRFVWVEGPIKEVRCDRCTLTVGGTERAILGGLDERDELERISAWRRGLWWND